MSPLAIQTKACSICEITSTATSKSCIGSIPTAFSLGLLTTRGELQSYVQRKQSFCIIAEPAENNSSTAGAAAVLVGNSEGEGGQSAGAKHSSETPNQGGRGGSRKGGIAGFVVVELHREGYGHVITLDVRRDFRRQPAGDVADGGRRRAGSQARAVS